MIKKISSGYFLILIAIFSIAVISGCYNKKADLIIPNNNCDTTVISYRSDVTSILQQNCYKCHSADKYAAAGGNYQLDLFSSLQIMVTNGKLLKAINHAAGAVPMPYGGGKLSDCDIMKITAWVNRGARDN